jgi:uncharacterized membrane protein YfhO
VLAVRRDLESVSVEAEADGDATLVVADAWWPGWQATIDGREVALFPADLVVRAVRWPAGRHVLEMRYRPPEVAWGWGLSSLGAASVALGVVLLRRRDARRASEADPPGDQSSPRAFTSA